MILLCKPNEIDYREFWVIGLSPIANQKICVAQWIEQKHFLYQSGYCLHAFFDNLYEPN